MCWRCGCRAWSGHAAPPALAGGDRSSGACWIVGGKHESAPLASAPLQPLPGDVMSSSCGTCMPQDKERGMAAA
eukprot:12899747-Prorocentrum_lima.AAC.1